MHIGRATRVAAPLVFLLSVTASCGGGTEPEERTTGGGSLGSAGGEGGEGGDSAGDAIPDPCEASAGSPCEEPADAGVAVAGAEDGGAAPTAEDAGAAGDPEEERRQRIRRGRATFERFCDTCHPGGEGDIGPTLRRIRFPVARMQRQIRQGSGRMRPIPASRLADDRMDDLMAYLSTIGAVRGVDRAD